MKLYVCTTKEFLHKLSETVSGKLICVLVVLRVLTRVQLGVVTDFSGQMLAFKMATGLAGEAVTSGFSMIMYQSPMLQGSGHSSWKMKMSFHGLHTYLHFKVTYLMSLYNKNIYI
jgi:hypothetical protein